MSKQDTYRMMCRSHFEENKNIYNSVKRKAKKAFKKSMRENVEEGIKKLRVSKLNISVARVLKEESNYEEDM